MQATVIRGDGSKQGDDVRDDLLTSLSVCLARGKRECDYHGSSRTIEKGQCPKHDHIETGTLVEVVESERQWRGKVKYCSLTLTLDENGSYFTADTGLHIERERE